MSRYYIKDTNNNNIFHCSTVQEVVAKLEQLCEKFTNFKTRADFMVDMADFGYGYDDPAGVYFTELMAEKVEIGVINKDGQFKRCNIHEHARNAKYRVEMGD